MKRERSHEVEQAAAEWAARVDRGLSIEEQSQFDLWLSQDVRRIGAFGRMRAIALQAERVAALGPVHSPGDPIWSMPVPVQRRQLLVGGGALAAGLAAAGWAAWAWRGKQHYQTIRGEVRQLALSDGSVVTLNTFSDLLVHFTEHRREVRLRSGEALFDVAHDAARPFVVVAGETEVRAVGTSFTVRNLERESPQVLVREGVVEVTRIDRATPPVRVTRNMRAVSAVDASESAPNPVSVAAVPPEAVQRALAWRDGRIAFQGETLAQAVTEFARYSDIRIIIDDPALEQQEIAGLYRANDPIDFAKLVAASLRAEATVGKDEVHIHPASMTKMLHFTNLS